MVEEIGRNGLDDRLEVLEFTVGGKSYGIDRAYVEEILLYESVKPVSGMPPIVEGIARLRDTVSVIIDLQRLLQDSKSSDKGLVIRVKGKEACIGLHVERIDYINSVSLDEILQPDAAGSDKADWMEMIIRNLAGQMVPVLNLEKIMSEIPSLTEVQVTELEANGWKNRSGVPVLIVEDSILLKTLMVRTLESAGYSDLAVMDNGREAWDYIMECRQTGSVRQKIQCVITDIEIPDLDGFRLTELIKSDEELKTIPVIIFSSLISGETKARLRELGADAQMSKPEFGSLAETIDRLVHQ